MWKKKKIILIISILFIYSHIYSQKYNAKYIWISKLNDSTWSEWLGKTEYNAPLEKLDSIFVLHTANIQTYSIKERFEPTILNDWIHSYYRCVDMNNKYCMLDLIISPESEKFFKINYETYAFLILLE
jgi:hypothetical protein